MAYFEVLGRAEYKSEYGTRMVLSRDVLLSNNDVL